MKISAEAYGKTVSVCVEHDDLTISEFLELLETIVMGLGYNLEMYREACGEMYGSFDKAGVVLQSSVDKQEVVTEGWTGDPVTTTTNPDKERNSDG